MRKTVVAVIGTALAFVACDSPDVHYVPPEAGVGPADAAFDDRGPSGESGSPDSGDDGAPADSGPLDLVDANAVGSDGFCGCDHTAGVGCCVPHGSMAFCSDTYDACLANGGMFILCESSNAVGDSACCWNETGGAMSTAAAATCGPRPTACTSDADCASGTCAQTRCGGILVGACGAPPRCP